MTSVLISILIIVLPAAIVFIAGKILISHIRAWRIFRQPGGHGTEADATILNVRHTGRFRSKLPRVKMVVQVKPVGARSFVVELKQIIAFEQIPQFRQGRIVRVKYNPDNPKQITLLPSLHE